MGTRANKLQKLQIPPNKILLMTILPVFSQLPLFFFPRHPKNLPFGISYFILLMTFLAFEKCRRMQYDSKYSGTTFLSPLCFVLNFLMDSVLNSFNV